VRNLTCIIVDDEPIARDLLVTYCNYLPNLKVVAVCSNALAARKILLEEKIDLLLLDINMPVLDGVSFLKTLNQLPLVIFTTAYAEHAATAFDMDACDYLVKPFPLERFIKAIDRAEERLTASTNKTPAVQTHVFIKAKNKIYQLKTEDILFAEASGNYTKIYLINQVLKPTIGFTAFEEMLSDDQFIRVHRSFIINKTKLTYMQGNRVFIENYEVPVGNHYKESVMANLAASNK